MPRLKLAIPASFQFIYTITVRITDINYGGHMGNDSLLAIIHEARMQYLQHYGYSEMDIGGVALIMNDVAVTFKNEAFFGDQLKISITSDDFHRVGFDLCYKIEKEKDGQPILIAIAKTGMICFDYPQRKISLVPAAVLEKLQSIKK